MSGRSFFKALVVFSVCFLASTVEMFCATEGMARENALGKGSVVITSSTLIADKKTNSAVFEGSVTAKSDDMTLLSDRMTVSYAQDGGIGTIEAEGSVKLTKGEQVVVSEHAIYYAAEKKVTFSGSPRALQGGNVVTGTRMTYLLEEDRFIVEGSKVYLEQDSRLQDAGDREE